VQQGAVQQETTVTTRTTEVPGAVMQKPLTQQINREAVVTNVMEKPILENVIEKKHVEVHHKPVVQEIHEQKIIELEKQQLVQNVQKEAQFSQSRAETRFEEIGSAELGEQERLRLAQLRMNEAPKIVQQSGAVQQFQEQEVVGQVVKQEFIEKHVQPVITEVREQKVVQEVLHPVVRKVHEAPIIREVTSTQQPIVQQQGFQQTTVQQTNLQQGTQFQQGSFQKGGINQGVTTTTSTGNWSAPNSAVTTTTTGLNAEFKNMGQHEQRVIQRESGLISNAEAQNLNQHEKFVEAVGTGNLNQGSMGTAPLQSTTGTHQNTNMEGEKPGLFSRIKGKLHRDKGDDAH